MRQIAFLVVLGLCRAQAQNADLDAAIFQVFGSPPSSTPSPAGPSTLASKNAAQDQNNLDAAILAVFGNPPTTTTAGNVNLDAAMLEVFGTPPPVTASPPQASTLVPGVPNKERGEEADNSCQMEDGRMGRCVSYYLCTKNNSIVTDGLGVIDIRFTNSVCPSYMDICCLPPDTRHTDDPITPRPITLPQREGCGWRNPDGVGFRITGDKNGESKFGEFPWTVAILKIEPVNDNQPDGQQLNVYVGGGSLIHPSIVLSAAHYVANGGSLRARAGEWDTQTSKEIYPYQDRDVTRVIVHKDFNKGNLFYDIALLFLASPMNLAPNVGVACLPPPRELPLPGTRCFATGWGKDRFGKEGRYQVILKKVEVPVVDRNTCRSKLRQTRLGPFFELHSSFMCAGGEPGKDTCKGDGGSPLSCPIQFEKGRYMQSGIVAWGIGCGEDGTPGVYVNVANLRNWIDEKVIANGYESQVYTI